MLSAILTSRSVSVPHLPSRRSLLQNVAAGVLATLLPAFAGDASARKRNKHTKRRKRRKKRQNQPPAPAVQVAARCGGDSKFSVGVLPPQRLAQTFTAEVSGAMVRAELTINKEAGSFGDYFLHLSPVDNLGVPTNAVLVVASVANPDVPAGRSTVTFTFPEPATLTAGMRFALVLNRTGSDFVTLLVIVADQCGGEAFKSTDRTAPFTRFGEGSDFVHAVFVQK